MGHPVDLGKSDYKSRCLWPIQDIRWNKRCVYVWGGILNIHIARKERSVWTLVVREGIIGTRSLQWEADR